MPLLCTYISLLLTVCTYGTRINVHERATSLITKYEGFRSEAYLDTSGLYSIGWGTRSYQGEVISRQEATRRLDGIVKQSIARIQRDFPQASDSQIIGLTSLYFNCWKGYLRVKKEGFEVMKEPGFCLLKGHSGLIERRQEERNLILN